VPFPKVYDARWTQAVETAEDDAVGVQKNLEMGDVLLLLDGLGILVSLISL
jgi:hypothetical protein